MLFGPESDTEPFKTMLVLSSCRSPVPEATLEQSPSMTQGPPDCVILHHEAEPVAFAAASAVMPDKTSVPDDAAPAKAVASHVRIASAVVAVPPPEGWVPE